MKHIRTIVAVIITLSFSPAKSEVLNDIQHRLMDLSGLSPIINTPKLETTDQRNQFFDNYSVLSIPDIKVIDQMQLQNIQTFAPSHRKVSLDSLNKIKDITSGLTTQDIKVTLEDFKDISMQDGKITVPNISNKSQQVKDILSTANAVLQEVKSLNQKELNSLKLTVSDMRNIQKIMPMIQQQLRGPTIKDGKVNSISVDVGAMTAELDSARKEIATLYPKLTFADFYQLTDMDFSPNGDPIMPNYNKETASDSLNRFVEILNKDSKYIEIGAVPPPGTPLPSQYSAFQMKGPETITGKVNGLLNVAPALGSVGKIFSGSNAIETFTQTYPSWTYQTALPAGPSSQTVDGFKGLNWGGQSAGPLSQTVTDANNGFNVNLVDSVNTGPSAFDYLTNTSFVTIDSFQNKSLLSFPNLSLGNDLGGLCAIGTTCRQKLSIGDLNGAMNEMMNNLPEDARPR